MYKTSNKNKVIIIENSLGVTGAFKSIYNASKSISDKYEFVFAIDSRSKLKKWLADNNQRTFLFKYIEIQKSAKLLLYLPQLLNNVFKLKRLIKQENIGIVHVNDLYNMVGVFLKMLNPGVKVVYHVRLLPDSYVGKLYYVWLKLIAKYADKIICVSEAVFNALPDKSKAVVIYDSFYDEELLPVKTIKPAGEIKLLYLGNIIKGKGQDLALDAFIVAYKGNRSLRLNFIGGDLGQVKNQEFKQQLADKARLAGVDSVISFADFTENIEKEIKEADIVLNFSESESFSMVCLEALYFGTPLIATDCGGPREIFENGKSGMLVPNKDVKAMTEAILQLSQDLQLRKYFSENGREHVREKFALENTANKLAVLYKGVLK